MIITGFIGLTILATGILGMKSSRTLKVGNELDASFSVKEYGGGERDLIFIGIFFTWNAFVVPHIILNDPIKYIQYDYHFINEKSELRKFK